MLLEHYRCIFISFSLQRRICSSSLFTFIPVPSRYGTDYVNVQFRYLRLQTDSFRINLIIIEQSRSFGCTVEQTIGKLIKINICIKLIWGIAKSINLTAKEAGSSPVNGRKEAYYEKCISYFKFLVRVAQSSELSALY